jgi:hypothetical protein
MSKTNFSDKCKVIGDLWLFYREDIRGNEAWEDFFGYNDIALPLAYLIASDIALPGEDAEQYINETWDMFCDYIGIDPDGKYSSIADAFDASPNEPLKVEEEDE